MYVCMYVYKNIYVRAEPYSLDCHGGAKKNVSLCSRKHDHVTSLLPELSKMAVPYHIVEWLMLSAHNFSHSGNRQLT